MGITGEHDTGQAGVALEQRLTPEPQAQGRERETGPSMIGQIPQ